MIRALRTYPGFACENKLEPSNHSAFFTFNVERFHVKLA